MKKILALITMTSAVLAVSCRKENPYAPSSGLRVITVFATHEFNAPTKVTVGETDGEGSCPVLWQTGDAIKLINYDNENRAKVGSGTVGTSDNGLSSANVSISVDETVKMGSTKVKFMLDNGQAFGKPSVPSVQRQTGLGAKNTNFFDYTYAYTSNAPVLEDGLSFSLSHPFAYVKIPFKSSEYAGYALRSVTLTNTVASETGKGYPAGQISNVNHAAPVFSVPAENESDRKNILQGYVAGTISDEVKVLYSENILVSEEVQDAYIVALPTAIAQDMPEPTVYTVTIALEKDCTIITAAVKFKTILYPSAVNVLNVGEITKKDTEDISDDYWKQYEAGMDITLGDLTINKNTHPGGVLVGLDAFTDQKQLKEGGLVFVDDRNGGVLNLAELETSNQYTAIAVKGKELILIGRYKTAGKQTEVRMNEMRTYNDVSVLNMKLVAAFAYGRSSMSQMFAKSGDDENPTKLRLVDCDIDATDAQHVVFDKQSTASCYSDIIVENCIVRLSETKTAALYRLNSAASDTEKSELTIKNNVIYRSKLVSQNGHVLLILNMESPALTVNISNNTILNLPGQYGVIRYTSLAALNVEGNLVVNDAVDGRDASLGDNFKFGRFVYTTGKQIFDSKGCNFLTTIGWIASSVIKKFENPKLTAAATDVFTDPAANPFSATDYATGYFPANLAVVTNGAGASYDTKYYFSQTSFD